VPTSSLLPLDPGNQLAVGEHLPHPQVGPVLIEDDAASPSLISTWLVAWMLRVLLRFGMGLTR
jgi:hypothetical protein